MKIPIPFVYAGGILAVILNNIILRSGGLRSFQPYANTTATLLALVTILAILVLSGLLLPKFFRPHLLHPVTVQNRILKRLYDQLDEINSTLKEQKEQAQDISKLSAEIRKALPKAKDNS